MANKVKFFNPALKDSGLSCVLQSHGNVSATWNSKFMLVPHSDVTGVRGSVVGCGTMLLAGRSRVRVLMMWIL
jgi:hypothetical protein